MSIYLANSEFGKGDLTLTLTDEFGQWKNVKKVLYTIYSDSDEKVSGSKLEAVNLDVGRYYAPWFSSVKTGCYKIVWDIEEDCVRQQTTEHFYITDLSEYGRCPLGLRGSEIPSSDCKTFLVGIPLDSTGLTLFLKQNSFLTDAYAVFFTILDCVGNIVYSKTEATHFAQGSYYANYTTSRIGDFLVFWEYQETADSPLTSVTQKFSVVSGSLSQFNLIQSKCETFIIRGFDQFCTASGNFGSSGTCSDSSSSSCSCC